jgi:hypothetical protein
VDYPVGLPTNVTLKDPTTSVPSGCVYATNKLTCDTPNVTIDGYDFSLHNCVSILFKGGVGGTFTVQNSNFKDGSACNTSNGATLISNNRGAGPFNTSLIFQNNTMDGNAQETAYPYLMAEEISWGDAGGSGTVLLQYNAFLNTGARVAEPNTSSNVTYQYNYVEGFQGNSAHAEFAITNSGSGTMAHFLAQFNTFLQPAASTYPVVTNASTAAGSAVVNFANLAAGTQGGDTIQDQTTPTAVTSGTTVLSAVVGVSGHLTMSANAAGPGIGNGDILTISPNVTALHSLSEVVAANFTLVDVLNNTAVANSVVNGSTSASVSSLFEIAYATYGTVNWTSNYLDATGSLFFRFCQNASSPTIGTSNFATNVSLVTGSTVMTTYNQTGP